jgi:tRNA A-37 threonylcarbamoyl transferase component Bud32
VHIAGYQLVREIGRGGMSIVFLAQQLDLKRPVALKVLRPGLAVEAQHVERFQREAMSIARLQHPHIVQVYAVGETDGWHWLAMEYVEGKNLAQIYAELAGRERDPRSWTGKSLAAALGARTLEWQSKSLAAALCELLAPVARAIGVAHEIGLVHRDVKPSNILIHKDGRALIADFGLAKGDGDPGLSMTGEPIGTPYYMSPEQALMASARVDARTDVYSLGVTLYEGTERPPPVRRCFAARSARRDPLAAGAGARAVRPEDRSRGRSGRRGGDGERARRSLRERIRSGGDLRAFVIPGGGVIPLSRFPGERMGPFATRAWRRAVAATASSTARARAFSPAARAPMFLGALAEQTPSAWPAGVRPVGPRAVGGIGLRDGARGVSPRSGSRSGS